jgi:hypothetical protein
MEPKKILVLHGVAQSGPVFLTRRISTIVETLTPLGYDFVSLTGPFDIGGTPYMNARQSDYQLGDDERSWWETDDTTCTHSGIETAMELWGQAISESGPFSGVIGFSQGGCASVSIAAMLEPSRRSHPLVKKYIPTWHPPLDFLIVFSANPYRYPDETVHWLFYPEAGNDNLVKTRSLAFYGKKEWATVQSQRERQQWFLGRFVDVKVVPHPWAHTVPRTQEFADIIKNFILNDLPRQRAVL